MKYLIFYSTYTFFRKKTILNILNIFLNFYLFIFLVVYVVRFNTNDKRHFLTYMLTRMFNFPTFDGTAINNEDRKEF